MPARAPLDVDLEDKLLYGLTPMRLGYAVMALLCGFAVWSSRWAAAPIRAAACLVVFGAGATLAWGRWRGRAADGWLTDMAAFMTRTQRLVWNEQWVDRLRRRPRPIASNGVKTGCLDSGEGLTVAGTIPDEGDERGAEETNLATGVAFRDAAVATG